MSKEVKTLLNKHQKLIHSEHVKVTSHVQREQDDWFVNTVMLDGIDVPFKYKRKQAYRSLAGQRVNLTYYSDTESVAGFDIDIMRVVRIKVS